VGKRRRKKGGEPLRGMGNRAKAKNLLYLYVPETSGLARVKHLKSQEERANLRQKNGKVSSNVWFRIR